MSMRCNLSPEPVIFDYDGMCNLVRADYSMHESIFRTPDKVENLYRSENGRDRTYDGGGRLTCDGEFHYRYDCEGNLVHRSRRNLSDMNSGSAGRIRKGLFGLFSSPENGEGGSAGKDTPFADWQPGDTCYEWLASGMLAGVKTPDGKTVSFGYDALGRRVSKTVDGTVRRFGWDGNVVLHEWDIEEADRPKLITDGSGREEYDDTEKPENLVTWVYDGTSFTPVAKVTDGERYTIVHDYLGTPTQAYDSRGNLVWEMMLDVYGEVKECHGDRTLVPFRYQGQYEDIETGLYYNRFRYYSPQMGMYISSDPIELAGNNPTLYGYVKDVNTWIDLFGLDCNDLGKWGENKAKELLEDTGKYVRVFPVQNASGHGFDLVGLRHDGKYDIFEVKTTGVGPDKNGNRRAVALSDRQENRDSFISDILNKAIKKDFGITKNIARDIMNNIGDKRIIDIFVDNGKFHHALISIWEDKIII